MNNFSVIAIVILGLLVWELWCKGTPPSSGASPVTDGPYWAYPDYDGYNCPA